MSTTTYPLGPVTKHVNESSGADSNLMKFYSTSYATTYDKINAGFNPREGHHTGTGYKSNIRPSLSYTSQLDRLDNPDFGKRLYDNYETITKRSYQGHEARDLSFPERTLHDESGFTRDGVKLSGSRLKSSSVPLKLDPAKKPYLHQIQPRDPIREENFGHGASYMTTESNQNFRQHEQRGSASYGRKFGSSGFAKGANEDLLTFKTLPAHLGDSPGWLTHRPTGVSINRSDFQPYEWRSDVNNLPSVLPRASRYSAYTNPELAPKLVPTGFGKPDGPDARENRNGRPGEPNGRIPFGASIPDPGTMTDRIPYDTRDYGMDHPARFITHYNTKFLSREGHAADFQGHVWGDVQRPLTDGYTRSEEGGHVIGANPADGMHALEAYDARSRFARDAL